ncbi:hypothetical protein PI95_007860 [Hassallia byssoidea VB512170]|uniref:Uncharacterized protein n=1 Tax=Hassallia byssoidea VB512170 TaxID=1304833 RepID=A0A846H775_9CYAN|nr:hypothetical protein [Hassalia byssoidea]NEU72489.1 hypothetical protein [Hassalia byssoidea VB512170]
MLVVSWGIVSWGIVSEPVQQERLEATDKAQPLRSEGLLVGELLVVNQPITNNY